MATKLLVGVMASLLVTSVGVYVAFSGESTRDSRVVPRSSSEGSSRMMQTRLGCKAIEFEGSLPTEAAEPSPSPDALAACTGSTVMAGSITNRNTVIACCKE